MLGRMYFRLKQTRSTPVLQLVQSYRDQEGKPHQKILLSLGCAGTSQHICSISSQFVTIQGG